MTNDQGMKGSQLNTVVEGKLEQLDLRDFEHKIAGSLSGGNKRKLSVAMATIGEPPIVFLDGTVDVTASLVPSPIIIFINLCWLLHLLSLRAIYWYGPCGSTVHVAGTVVAVLDKFDLCPEHWTLDTGP